MEPLPLAVRERIDEIERRVAGLKSYCDVEVNSQTVPWFLWKLAGGGTLAAMSTSGYNFDRALSLEDLGFRLPQEIRSLIRGTKIAVIPPAFSGGFVSAQATAYRAVSGTSYDVDLVTIYEGNSWRYITWRAFERLEELVEHASKQHQAARTRLVENQSQARSEMEQGLVVIAEESLGNLKRKLGTDFKTDETFFKTAIITAGLTRFDAFMADLDKIGFRLRVKPIVLGAEILAAQAEETELQGKIREEQADRAARIRTRQIRVEERQRIADARVAAAQRDIDRDAEVKERVRQLQIETARKDAETALNPFRQGLAQLRARVYDDLVAVRDNLLEKGSLAPATSTKLASVLDTFRSMKFADDKELEELLESVSLMSSVTGRGRDRATPQVLAMLNEIVNLTSAEAQEVQAMSSGRASRVVF